MKNLSLSAEENPNCYLLYICFSVFLLSLLLLAGAVVPHSALAQNLKDQGKYFASTRCTILSLNCDYKDDFHLIIVTISKDLNIMAL